MAAEYIHGGGGGQQSWYKPRIKERIQIFGGDPIIAEKFSFLDSRGRMEEGKKKFGREPIEM
jgi:hypothetical protein